MPLKVIGAGLPRTGTNSLQIALNQLGFGPCHHMHELTLIIAHNGRRGFACTMVSA